ncbi:MAG TPA: DUF58 domain-containing protein [Nannocystis sp.]
MFPSPLLVLLLLAPLALSVAALGAPTLLWPMLAGDLAIALAAGLDAVLAARALVDVRRSGPEVLSIGRANPFVLELRSRARRRLRVAVTDDLFDHSSSPDLPLVVDLAPGQRVRVTYRLIPSRRGTFTLGAHTVRYRSPLGLWIRQQRIPARHDVRIYPDVQSVRDYELLARRNQDAASRATRRRGGESEFEALREYQRDDEYRSIDWKATARRHKLIARQYQLERDQSVVFMLDAGRLMTASSDDLSLFDHALNATLMLTYVASRGGDQVGLMTFAHRVLTYLAPGPGKTASQRVIRALFAVHPALVETDYEQAFRQLGPRLRKRSLVVIFTQVIDHNAAAALLRLVRGLQPRHLPLVVLFRDPAVEALVHLPEGRLTAGDAAPYIAAAAAELLHWRDRLIRDLKRGGAHVLDVLPRELSPALINRYLEVKARHLL